MKKNQQKKALAIITGIGYGHSIRQAPLLEKLKSNNYDIIVAGYANSFEYFQHKYDCIEILGPKFPERKFSFSPLRVALKNLTLPIKQIINYFKLKHVCKVFQPDIILTDFEPIAFSLAKNKPHFLIFNFDPELYKEYLKDRKKPFKLQLQYINKIYKKASKYTTIIPTLSRRHSDKINYINPIIREIPQKKDILDKYSNPIIVSLGGSYFGSEILERLLHILPNFENDFIIFSYKTIGKQQKNLHFMPFKENFLEYLESSKGVICFGGHNTISEAAVLKKPTLVFPVPNYIEQTLNAFEVEKNNFGISKILKHPLDDKEILAIVNEFLNSLKQIQENLNKTNIRGNGAEQAFKIIKNNS
jgi:uncharacterized protein (TIGR00661 family)